MYEISHSLSNNIAHVKQRSDILIRMCMGSFGYDIRRISFSLALGSPLVSVDSRSLACLRFFFKRYPYFLIF